MLCLGVEKLPDSVADLAHIGGTAIPATSKKSGDSEGNQKSGQRIIPVDKNGSLSKYCAGLKMGKASASRKSISSNDENTIAMILY